MTSFDGLIDSYLQGVDTLRKAIAGMTREQLLARPVSGRWSTLEVVAHIADFEPILAERIKRIVSHERPLLMVADENLFVNELRYQERDLNEELAVIESTRKQLARLLRGLPPEKIAKSGVHSQRGLISVEAVLTAAVNHIPHHVKFIDEKRRALAG
jgi:hypothetical protein